MKAVVTGANGFIGKALCKRLNKQNITVYPVDRNLLIDQERLKNEISLVNPDYIFHLAAYGNMSNQQDEDEIFQTNIVKTYNLLKATINLPYKIFINVSTSSVYGITFTRMKESTNPRPDTFYAATKLSAEHLCRAFRKKYKKVIVTVRPFSVYGEGEAEFRFIPTLIKNELLGKRSRVITGMHDWIHIDDFINGVMAIIHNYDCLPHRLYNIGTSQMTSNETVARLITDNFDFDDVVKVQDSPVWMAENWRLKSLNWEPKISIEEGVKRVYDHYKRLKKKNS